MVEKALPASSFRLEDPLMTEEEEEAADCASHVPSGLRSDEEKPDPSTSQPAEKRRKKTTLDLTAVPMNLPPILSDLHGPAHPAAAAALVKMLLVWSCLYHHVEGLPRKYEDFPRNYARNYIYRVPRPDDKRYHDNSRCAAASSVSLRHDGVRCPIVYHIHIPKTGGTSVTRSLMKLNNFIKAKPRESAAYITHGKQTQKFWGELGKRARSNSTLNWSIFSAEVGINDLARLNYQYFNEMCFFTVVREPRDWILSAENHMKILLSRLDFASSRFGYFDIGNIQSSMLGMGYNTSINPRPLAVCAFAISEIPHLLSSFYKNESEFQGLTRTNAHSHATNLSASRSLQLDHLIESRYSDDVELWKQIAKERKLCWY